MIILDSCWTCVGCGSKTSIWPDKEPNPQCHKFTFGRSDLSCSISEKLGQLIKYEFSSLSKTHVKIFIKSQIVSLAESNSIKPVLKTRRLIQWNLMPLNTALQVTWQRAGCRLTSKATWRIRWWQWSRRCCKAAWWNGYWRCTLNCPAGRYCSPAAAALPSSWRRRCLSLPKQSSTPASITRRRRLRRCAAHQTHTRQISATRDAHDEHSTAN